MKNSTKGVTWTSSNTNIATVDNGTITIKANATGKDTIVVKTFEGNATDTCFVTVLPKGALAGEFSVSATKKVHFSQGNLWYGMVGEATTATWNFETNQYYVQASWSASHVSHFFWSKDASVAYAETYNDDSADSDVFFTNETETTAKSNFTVNGVTGKYRTLSKDEWMYLFETRTMTNGGSRYEQFTKSGITIQDVQFRGVVLFPDDFTEQTTWKETYTTWEALNNAGLVFLRDPGYRWGSIVSGVGTDEGGGSYWSSSVVKEDYGSAYCLYLYNTGVVGADSDLFRYRGAGFSCPIGTS